MQDSTEGQSSMSRDKLFRIGCPKDQDIGADLDIKGIGGYIVPPGSTVEGRPDTVINPIEIAEAPQWLVERLQQVKPKKKNAGQRLVDQDDRAIELAENYPRTASAKGLKPRRAQRGPMANGLRR